MSIFVYGPVQPYDCFPMGSVYVYILYTFVSHKLCVTYIVYTHVVKEVVSFQGLSELLGMVHKLTRAQATV